MLVIYHLYPYTDLALALRDQITAALGAFFVSTACQTRLIHRIFQAEQAETMFDEISRDVPFHLAVIFMTESDPRGGWWHTSTYGNMKSSTVSEIDFLATCLDNLAEVARSAATARVFGISCGYNLRAEDTIKDILSYLHPTPYLSLVVPSTTTLLMCDFVPIFPELFLNLYYFGAALETSLFSAWGKSKEARTHTGLTLFSRTARNSEIEVKTILYTPVASRPFGVPLPVMQSICGCRDGTTWTYKTRRLNQLEYIHIYRAPCCQVELQVAIYPGDRLQYLKHEMCFNIERWDSITQRFNFNECDNVRMKIFPPSKDGKPAAVNLDGMWTVAGARAWSRQLTGQSFAK
ncbi:hypothetical protein RSOLAG1IB_11307 [Rhizoctonia solani AG-1 IB]|uniref:Uncharacterized protein n=1 Tax=Thanatephorus cucumeris (strain AG1-IB / isolate 7/3/14) TaxID=1108050 RepID=A0A0B7F6M4_THACB|nr:hypothetical protein RSOLAG1IB_11307 [Rhizoctonia solani AG-1 IB]